MHIYAAMGQNLDRRSVEHNQHRPDGRSDVREGEAHEDAVRESTKATITLSQQQKLSIKNSR